MCYITIYIADDGFNGCAMCIVHIKIRCTVPHLWIYSCFCYPTATYRIKTQIYSTWNSNYNMHSTQRTKSFDAKCDIRHEPSVLLRLWMQNHNEHKCEIEKSLIEKGGKSTCAAGKNVYFCSANCTHYVIHVDFCQRR